MAGPYANEPDRSFHKLRLVKPDGRNLYLYSRAGIPDGIVATNPQHDPITGEPHLRFNPLREEWVAYASHRQNRTFMPPKEYNPLLPSRSTDFPTELPVGAYDVAVFDNLFASLTADAAEAPPAYLPTRPGTGICEVVVFAQEPDASLATLPLDHIELLFRVWADRTLEIGRREEIGYVLPFENKGVEVGVTLHHPHGQIYAYPFVPPIPAKMQQTQAAHYERTKRGLVEDMIEQERRERVRVVYEDADTVAFVPVCARYPYEVWIAPVRPVAFVHEMTSGEIGSFARALKTVLLKYDGLFARPFPYLMVLYQAPTDGRPHPEFHFHVEFFPPLRTRDRLKFLAGTELGAGMFVNDALPEEKAAELRQVDVGLGD
ncbi:MAG TPA: galactose-1-phosphate uridylyltransferase [Microvirga sp.]|nr:galactose-1-phosphate uridylyltransferase [Microvirga sp.]